MTSLYPCSLGTVHFYYPLGNTPAVCLTQELPPEEAAEILLLGCGDARSVLFTAYADCNEQRTIDVTCCDYQPAIFARNIILFSLLIDSKLPTDDPSPWNIYFSLYITEAEAKVLHDQAKKLIEVSTSLETWRQGYYGDVIKMVDAHTLHSLRRVWLSYCMLDLSKQQKNAVGKNLGHEIDRAKKHKEAGHGKNALSMTAFRSISPLTSKATEDLPILDRQFWAKPDASELRQWPNPTFIPYDKSVGLLHFGTDYLPGFHMSLAYACLTDKSPLKSGSRYTDKRSALLGTARTQFAAWCTALKSKIAKKQITLRFFAGDALAFCHSLADHASDHTASSVCWYQSLDVPAPIMLDPNGLNGSLCFNVIDTSNLADHLGSMNVLVAVLPLISASSSASLYIESLVKKESDLISVAKELLLGDLGTMSSLMSLFPVEYWTNSSPASPEESIWSFSSKGQMFCRFLWKTRHTDGVTHDHRVVFEPIPLAELLYKTYLNMFQNEDHGRSFSNMGLGGDPMQKLNKLSQPLYHRGSLVAFLALVKNRVDTDWPSLMTAFMSLVYSDRQLYVASNYVQELLVHLHLRDLYNEPAFLNPKQNLPPYTDTSGGLHSWSSPPAVLRVTLVVPREKLRVFTGNLEDAYNFGTANVHCLLQCSPRYPGGQLQNIFAGVHMTFGNIRAEGKRYTPDYEVSIEHDSAGWAGSSPMVVSFWAPTATLLWESETGIVAFGLQSTPATIMSFSRRLSLTLNVFETTLGNTKSVFITKRPPNFTERPRRHADLGTAAAVGPKVQDTGEPHVSMHGVLDGLSKVKSLTGHLHIKPGPVLECLAAKAPVAHTRISAFEIAIDVGEGPSISRHPVAFPMPVNQEVARLRIARTSGYVEVVAPLADPLAVSHASDLLSIKWLDRGTPVLWNMPRVHLDRLPILDLSKKTEQSWVVPHLGMMWSARERKIREAHSRTRQYCPDPKLNFKESLFSLFVGFSGQQGAKQNMFGLNRTDGMSSIDTIILPLALRLDVANHTVVLDAVVLPLNDELVRTVLGPFLTATSKKWGHGISQINVNIEEQQIWKHMLPVYVERCRTWSHEEACEYRLTSLLPLSTAHSEIPMCSCGMGKVSKATIDDFPGFDIIAKHAVRAAISPCYGLPFVEKLIDEDMEKETQSAVAGSSNAASPSLDNCARCGKKEAASGGALLNCGGCRKIAYCSKECQKQGWPAHKSTCKKT